MINDARSFIQQYIALNRTSATSRDLARLYAVSHTAGACADLRAKTIGSIPMVAKKDGELLPDEHPLSQVVAPRSGIRELMTRAEYAMYLWGRCLLYKERNVFQVTRSLRWINPLIYMLDETYSEGLRGFRLTPGGHDAPEGTNYIALDDAVYMHAIDFEDDFDGVSPLERAFLEASVEPEAAQTLLALFRNRAIPATYVQPTADSDSGTRPNDNDAKGLIEQIRSRFQGALNAGRTLVTLARWDWKQLQGPMKDMAVQEIRDDVRLSVCVASGIPYELVVMKNATYENIDGARRAWGELWVEPTAHWYAEQLTKGIASEYGPGYTIEPDFSTVAFLQEKTEQRMAEIERKVQLGIIDLYTAQIEAGAEPDESLRDLFMVGGVPVPRSAIPALWKAQYPAAVNLLGDVAGDSKQPEIYAYHIDAGIVTRDEVRERLGFPPDGNNDDEVLRELNAKLATMQLAYNSGIPVDVAAQMVGLELPAEFVPAPRPALSPPQLASGDFVDVTPPEDGGETRAEPSLWVGLYFENNPDLIALQQRLREMYPEATDWTEPADFHVTIAYAPSVSDEQVEAAQAALEAVALPELTLSLGSLRAFDNVGQYALHFRIRRNQALIDLQQTVVTALREAGIPLSSYSDPLRYTPHVTMCYTTERPTTTVFQSSVRIEPTALSVAAGEDVLMSITPEGVDPYVDVDDAPIRTVEGELRTAQRFMRKHGSEKYLRRFEYRATPDYIADWIRDELAAIDDDARDVRGLPDAIFADALLINDVRAYYGAGGTRKQFYDDILSVIRAAQADETTRRQFAARMRALLRRYGLIAFRDGMNEVGYDPESFSKEQLATFRTWQDEQSGYVTNLGAEIFRQGITEGEIELRARMWADISLDSIRVRGMVAGGNPNLKRVLGEVKTEHCPECLALAGQIHPASEWAERNLLIGTSLTTCKQGCHCGFEITDEPERGNWL